MDLTLRTPQPSAADRKASGKALRDSAPRSGLGEWTLPAGRPDPVEWMRATSADRLPDLVGIRVGRMVLSPFAFLRGAADLMAIDLVGTPDSGILTTIAGDAHLANFGFYASPERQLVMDVNDFDQAHPGPWEWDVRRLGASIVVAGRGNGLGDDECRAAVTGMVRQYAKSMGEAAERGVLQFHVDVFSVEDLRAAVKKTSLADEIAMAERKARTRTNETAAPKFTEPDGDGRLRIVDEPPLLVDVTPETSALVGATQEEIVEALDRYVATLPYEWQRVLRSYTVMDVAYRVTGVGSAGLRTYLALLVGNGLADTLFLQLKQSGPSVLEGRVQGPASRYAHNGERIVKYQQRSQTVSDPLLGWTDLGGRDFYVRQLRDMKGAVPIEELDATELGVYARLCGALLARAHARAGDPAYLSGYLGKGGEADVAAADFAVRYADQTLADWTAVRDAALAGDLPYVPDERT